ncbi:MAG: CbiX/SirB N-terminal domain-containing protein [Brooklawnia sp.]|jgi:sirohydrochlorin cobaltochelatase
MTALVIAAHGTRVASGQQACRALIERVRAMLPAVRVLDSYVELDEPSIQVAVADALESDPDRQAIVVPLMIGTGGHVREDIPEGITAGRSQVTDSSVIYTPHLGPDPRLRAAVHQRIRTAMADWTPEQTTVVFLGRGTSVTEANADHERLGRILLEEGGYADLVSGYIQVTSPGLAAALDRAHALGGRRIVVMPHYLFPGRLQQWAQQQASKWAETHPDAEVRLAEVIGDCNELAAVVVDRYRDALAGHSQAAVDTEAPQLYLSALRLAGRPVLAVGAGRVASRRIDKLLAAGAEVHVVAPEASEKIRQLAESGRLTWSQREFVQTDLDQVWYALAMTDAPQVNAEVAIRAESRQIFCVRADDAAEGTAWTPATGTANGLWVGVVGDRDPHRSARARTAAVAALRQF